MAMGAEDYQRQVTELAGQGGYQAGATVQEASQRLTEVRDGKPSSYTNQDADRLGGVFQQIMDRGPFSYDPGKDNVYKDYAAAYQQAGKQATNETRNAVNGLGGGYGNNWSGAVAGQQYGEYMKGINDILPELEQNAYNAYVSDEDRLKNMYEVGMKRDETMYGRQRDQVADWKADRSFAAQQADLAYSRDYQRYSDAMAQAQTYTGWEREDAQTARSDAYSWAIKLIGQGIMPNQDILDTAGISYQDALRLAKKYGYGKGSGHGSSGSGKGSGSGGSGSGGSGSASGGTIYPSMVK